MQENNRIYVCEWVRKKDSFSNGEEELCILQNFDYTYHYTLEQAQEISSLKYVGYHWGKGNIFEKTDTIIENSYNKEIHCECIWIYENNFSIGRYVLQGERWIYDAYCEKWHQDWEEMLMIPVPLIE